MKNADRTAPNDAIDVLAVLDEAIARDRASHQNHEMTREEQSLRTARAAVAVLIGAANPLAPQYGNMATVRGRMEMGRRLRTLATALARVRGEA